MGGNFTPCCFSLDNSEIAKAVTLAFCSIWQHFIIDIHAKFGIPNSLQSLDIWQNSDESISHFRISGQSLIKKNCHNSRNRDDIGMKLGRELNLTRETKKRQKKLAMTLCRQIVMSLSIWSNQKSGFRTYSLQSLHFH